MLPVYWTLIAIKSCRLMDFFWTMWNNSEECFKEEKSKETNRRLQDLSDGKLMVLMPYFLIFRYSVFGVIPRICAVLALFH